MSGEDDARPGLPAETGRRDPARVFGEVADDYDRVRPAYPAALVDDVLDYAGSAVRGRRALEVGAGTGRATVAFAAREVPIVAVEPDAAMADVLTRRIDGMRGVEVVRSTFEDFRPAERFGLLLSAEAWHWTEPSSRWARAAGALADTAALALIWNNERVDDPARRAAMLRVFADHAPSVVIRDEPVVPDDVWRQWPGEELSRRSEFRDLASRHYRVRRTVSKAAYLGLTRTRSQFRMLPAPTRRDLLAALSDLFDDEVPLLVDTALVLARRR
ncbi:class I SAM-dependent methyltransferase [Jidongwangia harbinensis]|uniref:class I SAM-dependent methyltransferase n=1 Tax=Jidongwangia harbinensis TaxID=2878561 RepID=UPI001CD95C0D|nr:class I SAM-dependent methyltransferase [Jidongwangia harbinensis]MCA2211404.1 class I SAM-dependent methyltransferase [Jidongwangia harbinensis]